MTVYANRVALRGGKPTAMVLPVPCSAASREAADGLCGISVLDMGGAAANLFSDLKAMFPRVDAPMASAASFGGARSLAASTLEVHRSGSYRYSVVPSINDFARLDQTVFDLKAGGLEGVLMAHYLTGFAFLACIIDRDADLVPIAYTHDKLPSKKLFVPTRHHHGTEGSAAAARAGRGDHGASHPPSSTLLLPPTLLPPASSHTDVVSCLLVCAVPSCFALPQATGTTRSTRWALRTRQRVTQRPPLLAAHTLTASCSLTSPATSRSRCRLARTRPSCAG